MSSKTAVLINPPSPSGYMSNKDSMGGFGQLYAAGASPFPPLDIPYLAAVLTQEQFGVQVIEAGAPRGAGRQGGGAPAGRPPHRGGVVGRGTAPAPHHSGPRGCAAR